MIFKTFDNDIDKWTAKIGIFGKSFNDIFDAKNKKKLDIDDLIYYKGMSLDEAKKQVGSFWSYLYPKKEDIQNQLIDVDKLIPKIDASNVTEATEKIKKMTESVAKGKNTWQKLFDALPEGEKQLAKLGQQMEGQIITEEKVIEANQQARASALAQNEAIETQTLSAKAGQVALQALAIAGNMIVMWAVSKAIELLVTGVDNIIHSAERCKERVDELMSSYQSALAEANSNAQTVEELADKYEKLSKGVNNLGENISLTTDEYAEYNKIVNQIADMFPNLIQGYTSEGNAILSLKGNVEELRNAYKEAQQEAYNMLIVSGKDSNGNDIITNFQNIISNSSDDFFKWDSSTKEYVNIITDLYNAMFESEEEYKRLYKEMTSYNLFDNSYDGLKNGVKTDKIKKILKEIGFTKDSSKLSDGDKKNIANNARAYIQTYQAEINSALKNVQTLANAYLMTNGDYAKLDEQSQNAASIIVNSINERIASGFDNPEDVGSYVAKIVDTIKTNSEARNALVGLFTDDLSELSPQQAKEVVDQYIKCIAKALDREGEELELKVELGFEYVDTTAHNYNAVMKSAAEKFSGVTPQHGTHIPVTQEERELFKQEKAVIEAFMEENSINTQDEIASFNKLIEESETWEEVVKKYLASKFTNSEDDTLVPTISSSISTIATQLEPQFTELGKLYNEIFQTDDNGNVIFSPDSVDFSTLESLRKSFTEIEKEIGVTFDPEKLNPFFDVLYNGGTGQEVQQAFNDLATAYLYSTDTLEQLNDETANAIKKQLEQMGVANAEAVVAEALALKNKELALSKKYLSLWGKELADATDSEVLAFMAEQAEAGYCGKELAALQLQKLLVNGTLLDTETDINNVMRLAKAAGISTESLSRLITLKAAYKEAEEKGNFMTASNLAIMIRKLEQDFQNEVNNFELDPVDIEFKAPDSGKSSASSSAAKQTEKDWKNVLDKETDLLEKQLAANIITFQEYTDKRRQIIEDYYRDGKIKAEEYYDALESMYGSQLSLYDRVVNAVTNRIDDEIDKLKDQKEAIENSYQVRIDAIQEEIDALNKANDARKAQIDLEKAQYEAERARNQRVNKVYDGSQFVYTADMEAVRDAEDDLADKEFQMNISQLETQIELLKAEMENATKSLDNQIDALEAYKDKWNEISDIYQKQQDKLLAAEIMGSEWERDILKGRLDTLQSFTEQYIALQQAQIDIAAKAAKIKAEAEAGNVDTPGKTPGGPPDDPPDGDDPPDIPPVYDRKRGTFYIRKYEGYASGTDNARKGLNLVGEDGTETFIDNAGNISLVTKPTLIPMEGGEVVKNAEETKAMLDTGNIEPVQSEGMRALFERIKNMQPSDFSFQSLMQPLSAMVNFPNMDYSHMLHNTSAEPTPVVQHITLTLPNVTNNSGADYLIKTLERLPLDNLQHMHRRKR